VLHVLPQEYVIDNQDSIREPLGMSGVRLESHVHLVTCANNAIQNIEKCVKRCGIGVDGFVLEQLASSYSVLSEMRKSLEFVWWTSVEAQPILQYLILVQYHLLE
jgi:cell division protein FtsA